MRKVKIAFSAVTDTVEVLLRENREELVDWMFDNSNLPSELNISLLCNPLTDGKYEETLNKYFHRKDVDIYLDSGGFQLLRGTFKGKKDEIKEQVYKKMAEHADYAFCFDESPLENNGKTYNHEKAVWAALETNKNIIRQIEVFKETQAKTKILPIFQIKEEDREGAAENLLQNLDFNYIGGVSLNSRTWGASGTLNFSRLAFFKETIKKFPQCPNFLHLLGYGEIRTLAPVLAIQQTGYLGDDSVISADSSSYPLALKKWGMVPKTDGSAKRVSASLSNGGKDWYNFQKWCLDNLGEYLSEDFKDIGHFDTKKVSTNNGVVNAAILMIARKGFRNLAKNPIEFSLKYGYLNEPQVRSIEAFGKTDDFKDYEEWRNEYHEVWRDRKRMEDSKQISRSNLDAFF